MEKELMVLKPNILNAIIPVFVKNLGYACILGGVAFGLYWLIFTFGTFDYPINQVLQWFIFFLLIFPAIPAMLRLIVLYNTKYIFFDTYIVSEFEFLRVKRHSTPYHQIVNIISKVSIWDRFCGTGDVTMHTAEDRLPDLTLFYVKNPDIIERKLYEMVRREKKIHAGEISRSLKNHPLIPKIKNITDSG